jgi:hypothetical protein
MILDCEGGRLCETGYCSLSEDTPLHLFGQAEDNR